MLMVLIIILVIIPFITKKLWPYFVTNLFPGAVEQNLISKNMPWPIAIIISIILLGIIS